MNSASIRKLAAAFVGVFGVLVAIGVVVISGDRAEAANWKEQLSVCAKSDRALRVDCFEEVFYAAYSVDDVDTFNIYLERVERDYPESSMDCHTGGHQAGRRAASGGEYVKAVLGGVSKKNICGNGFIHGAFDEVAHQQAPAATYQILAKVCDKVPAAVRIAGCVDGYGHSTWLNTRDLDKALELCMYFSEANSRQVCLAGIMMQMYREDPFTGAAPVMTIDRADEVCEQVVAKTASAEMERTCYYEAAWPIALEAGSFAEEMMKNRPAGVESWMPPKELIDNTRRLYLIAFNNCENYPSWANMCREKISRSPIWRVSGDAQINAAICSVFPGEFATLCVKEERVGRPPEQPLELTDNQGDGTSQPGGTAGSTSDLSGS